MLVYRHLSERKPIKNYKLVAKQFTYILLFFVAFTSNAQDSLEALLNKYNTKSVPYITVQELAMPKTKAIIFDAREPEEYSVSHLKNSISVGYNSFDMDAVESEFQDKNQMIVVYCSIGIRSETIGEKLQKAGYKNIHNLYGGIFEWKDRDFPIFDANGKKTDKVHVFSKAWGKWLQNGIKVYDLKDSN